MLPLTDSTAGKTDCKSGTISYISFKFNVQSDGAFLRAIPFDLENPEKIMTYISDLC